MYNDAMGRKDYDLDDIIKSQEERENREATAKITSDSSAESGKVYLGVIEAYFSRLGVAALKLEESLAVGDIIEIGDEEEAIRQRVSSMQIDRKDVNSAGKGDSVGILVRCPVKVGTSVYKIYRF